MNGGNKYYNIKTGDGLFSSLSFINNKNFNLKNNNLINRFVFGGSNGSDGDVTRRIGITDDLTNWGTPNTQPSISQLWNCSAFSSTLNMYVMGSDTGRIAYSNDGISWNYIYFGNSSIVFRDVVWSPQLQMFVIVSNNVALPLMTSTDGINWVARTSNGSSWMAIEWSPELGLFVAVSSNTQISISSNGITWTAITAPNRPSSGYWADIVWSRTLGMFYVVSDYVYGNKFIYSTNGTTWTEVTSPANRSWTTISYSNELGIFVASGQGGNIVATSTDGLVWVIRTTSFRLQQIIWSKELLKFVGCTSVIRTSDDGINWVTTGLPNYYNNFWYTLTEGKI